MASPSSDTSAGRLLFFSVADKAFSVPAADVLEVRKTPSMTRVPNASPSLAGLMNYHGAAIAVVRMSSLLELTPRKAGAARNTRIVVYQQNPPVGLLVDQVIELSAGGGGRRKAKSVDVDGLLGEKFVAGKGQKTRLGEVADRQVQQPSSVAATVALLGFRVAGQRYALPLGAISEVIVLPEVIAELPRGAKSAVGMLSYRDGVLPLVSVAALLGLAEPEGRRHVLVAHIGDGLVGLVVGTVDGVLRIPEAAVEPVPVILQRGQGDAELEGIARLGDDRALVSILSPSKLFKNRDVEQAIAQANTGAAAMAGQQADTSYAQFVVFRLGDEPYGLPIASVDEVARLPEALTRVPGAPAFVAGVMNLRGKPLPLIDQRRRFGRQDDTAHGRVVVVTTGNLQAGIIVDSVSEILRVAAKEIVPAPRMPGEGARVFDRIAPSGDEMVLIVDPQELLDQAERDLLARFKPAKAGAGAP